MTTDEFTPQEIALYEADAAEARRGYSVEYLDSLPKRRLRGRPLEVGDKASVMIRFRMDPDRLAQLDEASRTENKTRSQFIRDAIDMALVG
ncbi:MAG: ribbon-helix-helix domain-containing protein [Propionibacteriaceae bacterium]|nr:ribbon-helix-helix domain-containing protein [Propionibacteriaceae bacterium]